MGFLSSVVGDVFGGLTGGEGSLLGGLAGGGLGLLGGMMQNSAQSAQAQQQEQFQADMSGTAYQRGVADMRKAGLNPALAYSQGGASTPSGAMAPIQNIGSGAVNSATSSMAAGQQLAQMASSIDLNKANASAARAAAANSAASAGIKAPESDVGHYVDTLLRNSAAAVTGNPKFQSPSSGGPDWSNFFTPIKSFFGGQ